MANTFYTRYVPEKGDIIGFRLIGEDYTEMGLVARTLPKGIMVTNPLSSSENQRFVAYEEMSDLYDIYDSHIPHPYPND